MGDPGPRVEQGQGQGVLGRDHDQEVQQSQDQAVQQNQDQAVQGGQDLGVLLNLDLGVQQDQGLQAHQGRDRPEAGETNRPVQVHRLAVCSYCFYRVDSSAPISSVKSYFWLCWKL